LNVPNIYSNYQWLLNGAIISNAIDSSYTTLTTGNFQILVIDSSGCANSSNIITVVNAAPNPATIVSSNGSFTICSNQQLSLSVPQIYDQYQWFYNAALIAGSDSNSITTSNAGIYYVITHTTNACYDTSASIEVIVNQTPNPTITPSSTKICLNQTVTLQSSNFSIYQWYLNNAPITNANAFNYTTNQVGNYTVIVEDANGCTGISNQALISIDSVEIFINANAQSYCTGDIAILTAYGTNFSNLLWSNNSVGTNIQTGESGNYTVIATSAIGCTDTASYNLTFLNQLFINASVSDSILNCNETIQLSVSGADKYLWEPSTGLNDATINNPLITELTNDIIYVVTGTTGNCTAIDSIKIGFENCGDIFIPNAFSPNGDGSNDEFRVQGNNIFDFNLKIYNRWGALIFETSQIEIGWDGKYNGKEVNSGVYVWVLNAKDKNGQIIDFNHKNSGNLSLFR
jgi:gliding motility-associated-like protein